ncbi:MULTISPECIES: metal-dependent hydrolase [unclassified Novosphingobium]|uniref:metal-dependent hydrolase n=1 Tax=unclassified Novosphingobium TaxID=2644732 RepID=UPI00135A19F1|nr:MULTISPECIES: metal-dependent hydrolase [unclassified Novosphingobium]
MQVRKPDLLTQGDAIIWSRTPEVALFFNAMSAVIPYVEHYLNNVVDEVRADHSEGDPALRAMLGEFIRQETEHSKLHARFNKRLFDAGYGELKPLLRKISDELQSIRGRHSLAFNAAYCAGFENSATFSAAYLLGPGLPLFEGADPAGANLILWHVAEEFEHRAVCHEAFHAVSGSYFLRLWGLAYAFVHVNYSFKRAGDVIFRIHRQGMSRAQVKASKRRFRRFLLGQLGYMAPRMLQLLHPRFDPAKLEVPEAIHAALAHFAGPGPFAENYGDTAMKTARVA